MSVTRKTERNISGFLRLAIIIIALALQLLLLFLITRFLKNYAIYVYVGIQILAILQILNLMSKNRNNDYTIVWMLVIFLSPVFGQLLYLLWGRTGTHGKYGKRVIAATERSKEYIPKNLHITENLKQECPDQLRISKYLSNMGFPLYSGTSCKYFPLGELQFQAMFHDMEKQKNLFLLKFLYWKVESYGNSLKKY